MWGLVGEKDLRSLAISNQLLRFAGLTIVDLQCLSLEILQISSLNMIRDSGGQDVTKVQENDMNSYPIQCDFRRIPRQIFTLRSKTTR